MGKEGTIDVDLIEPLWTAGWHAKETFAGLLILSIVTFFTEIPGWVGAVGILIAFILPPVAVVYVWLNWKDVRDAGLDATRAGVSEVVELEGNNIERFSLINKSRPGILLPPREFFVTTLLVEDNLLLAHSDATIDIPGLAWKVGDSTTEFYYDQVTNINYEPTDDDDEAGEFWINLSGGHGEAYESTRKPDDALSEVQTRLRRYKQSS